MTRGPERKNEKCLNALVARTLRSQRDKALDVTVNGLVQFAIDGSTCYLRDEEGKEHRLSVKKKTAK